MKVYLAGPLGFSKAGSSFYNGTVVPAIESLSHVPLDPWSNKSPAGLSSRLTDEIRDIVGEISAAAALDYGPAKRERWRTLNMRIGAKNRALIDECDAVFAILDGTDVDSGTAAEIGYAFAKGKPILGYRGDFRLSADNDGAVVNLQVEYFILAGGGEIIMAAGDGKIVIRTRGGEMTKGVGEKSTFPTAEVGAALTRVMAAARKSPT